MSRVSLATIAAAAAGAVAISLAGAGVASATGAGVIPAPHPNVDNLVGGLNKNLESAMGAVHVGPPPPPIRQTDALPPQN